MLNKMLNKIICDTCKGIKVYQVSNLEFEICDKCKGKGFIEMEKRKREILNLVIHKLMENNISFKNNSKILNVKNYFKMSISPSGEIEIITKKYNKDFKFLSDVSDASILDIIDRIIFNY